MAMTISEMVRSSAPAGRLDRTVAVAFVLALVLPGVAFLAGARPQELENAAPASMPDVSLGALAETGTYAAIDEYVADGLPGRDTALRVYAGLDYQLLGGSSSPQVVPGRGDWLFYIGELRPVCRWDAAGMLRAVDAVAGRAAAAGVAFRFVIAPDKHAIHPEALRPDDPLPTGCTDTERAALRAGFASRPDSTVDLWTPVEASRDAAGEPVYFAQDSHWTPTAALAAIGTLVESLAPAVWDPGEISIDGSATFPMELARLIGLPRDAVIPAYVVRPAMRVTRGTIPTDARLTNAAAIGDDTTKGDRPVVRGTTLIVCDSFFNIYRTRISPWFERTIWVHVSDLRDAPELVADLPPIDRIIVERLERNAYELDLERLLDPVLARTGDRPISRASRAP